MFHNVVNIEKHISKRKEKQILLLYLQLVLMLKV